MSNKHFVGTTFVTGEAPPATKLNTFNDRILAAFQMGDLALSQLGGDDRVIDNPDIATELEVTASGTPDMNVHVNTGMAMVSSVLVQNKSSTTKQIVAPTTNNRYTIIQISNQGVITTVNGTEAASPVAPSALANNIKLADIYLPQNTLKIEDSDLGNGFITDRRDLYMYHPTTVKRFLTLPLISGTLLVAGGPNGDGYYYGTSTTGFVFGGGITIKKVFTQVMDIPVGADITGVVHNVTQATSDTFTHTDGEAFDSDSTIDLDFAATDEMAIQITQVGINPNEGGWLSIILQYILQ